MLFSLDNLAKGTDLGTAPTWSAIAFALPAAMLAFTGLETVANLAAETREPGRTLPRSLFVGIGAVGCDLVPDRDRRDLGLSGTSRPRRARRLCERPRHGVVARAARRPGRGVRRRAPGTGRRCPAHLRRRDGHADPRRGRDDVVLGCREAGLFDGALRHAPARLRAAQPPDAHLARVDRLHRGALRGRAAHRESARRARPVPRQPLQLRDPDRLHRGAGRRRSPPVHRAGARAPVPRSRQRADQGDRGAGRSSRRRAAHVCDLAHRDRHARCCPHCRPGLDRLRARRLHDLAHSRARAGPRARRPSRRGSRAGDRGRVPADPRADEDRHHRRRGARRPRSGSRRSSAVRCWRCT